MADLVRQIRRDDMSEAIRSPERHFDFLKVFDRAVSIWEGRKCVALSFSTLSTSDSIHHIALLLQHPFRG